MDNLELRKAALTAAGWEARQITPVWTDLFDNVGEFILGGTGNVWDDAPPVESSVDAALRWLVLGEGCNWTLASYIAGLVEPGWIARITGEGGRTVFCDTDTLAVAMCQAYLQYKAGA